MNLNRTTATGTTRNLRRAASLAGSIAIALTLMGVLTPGTAARPLEGSAGCRVSADGAVACVDLPSFWNSASASAHPCTLPVDTVLGDHPGGPGGVMKSVSPEVLGLEPWGDPDSCNREDEAAVPCIDAGLRTFSACSVSLR